ncbi:hypothetical protein Q4577_03220 [Marinovum sp. 2_MG-2023]|uniref:hypothetical protein n=1 Tax=Roseobacteraceae TaxID=2854170 RepID=UPI001FD2C60A|nr:MULTISPECIES: hypothetical protein [Roseobacteraceae]MCJ7873537.1 hypothetical protein [Phaeobacter sp. J2-8]MDO6729013.1 hypothetical protein [Marinovum sp. 2_MG-2023]MDO6779360.1 hypothetical protein [Marinovum sp. 1_MG-2023]
MSSLLIFFIVCGIVATVLFVAGYTRGVRGALKTFDDDTIDTETSGDLNAKWWMFGIAVVAASVVIALIGVAPVFIYLGPLLAIGSAAANGVAFFLDTPMREAQ